MITFCCDIGSIFKLDATMCWQKTGYIHTNKQTHTHTHTHTQLLIQKECLSINGSWQNRLSQAWKSTWIPTRLKLDAPTRRPRPRTPLPSATSPREAEIISGCVRTQPVSRRRQAYHWSSRRYAEMIPGTMSAIGCNVTFFNLRFLFFFFFACFRVLIGERFELCTFLFL